MRSSPNIQNDFLRGMRMTHLHRFLTHNIQQLRILKPTRHLQPNRFGIFAKISESPIKDNIHIPRLLPRQMRSDHDRQTHRRGLGNRPRSGFAHQHIRRNHILRHIRDKSHRNDGHIPRSVRHILPLRRLGRRPIQRHLNPPAARGVLQQFREESRSERFVRIKTLRDHRIPASGLQILLQFFVSAAYHANRGIHPLHSKFGIQFIHDIGEGSHTFPATHDENHSFIRIDLQSFSHLSLILFPPFGGSITHGVGLTGEIVSDGEAGHEDLFVGDSSSILCNFANRLGCEVHFVNIFVEPSAVS
mmetsp:Transcript_21434/g.45070  ORF Transcript_21434/g.45070 Transcript_21434/m.45070 type:complete len:303 (+) Transcript_21434:465-1373(+)